LTYASTVVAIAGTCAAAVIDARTGYIPDRISGAAACVAFAVAAGTGTFVAAAAGAATVAGSLLALFALTRGRGLGFGDVKLGVTIGAGYGAGAGMFALAAAFVSGALFAACLLASGRRRLKDALPFAPFLAAGTIAAALRAAAP
jgi:leader peptidase (prepilin peptidase)/N-methyltransferase